MFDNIEYAQLGEIEYELKWDKKHQVAHIKDNPQLDDAMAVFVEFKSSTYMIIFFDRGSGRHDEEHLCAMITHIDGDYDYCTYSEDFLGGNIASCLQHLIETAYTPGEQPLVFLAKATDNDRAIAGQLLEKLLPAIAQGLGKNNLDHDVLVDLVIPFLQEARK